MCYLQSLLYKMRRKIDASVIMYKYLITINYIIEIIYVVILTPICLEVIFRRLLIKLAADCTFKFYSRFFKQVDR